MAPYPEALSTLPRLKAVDVFRGATIAAMVLVNAQFSSEESYPQLAHAAWNGWTFADTIFPSFLFIVGVSLTLSTASRLARGEDRARLIGHAVLRSLVLFACGVAIDYLRFPARDFLFFGFQPHLHLTGVLQRIALCYLIAFHLYLWAGLRGVIAGIISFNLLYLALLYLYPVPRCGAGVLTVECNFPGYLDEILLHGFRWNSPDFDGDGLGSILPAVSSVLFGVLAGRLLLAEPNPRRQLPLLLGGGLVLIAAGELLSTWVPINKHLWTTSYAVLTAGLAAAGLACTVLLVDRASLRRWTRPLEIFGSNAVAAYLVHRLVMHVPRVHVMEKSLHNDVLLRVANHPTASLLFATLVLLAVYLVLWVMDRQGWHLKL